MVLPLLVLLAAHDPLDLDSILDWDGAFDPIRAEAGPVPAQDEAGKGSGGYRFLQRFAQDAAVVDLVWLEARLRGQSFRSEVPDTDVYLLEPVFAVGLGGTLEGGLILRLLDVESDFDPFDDESGLGDTDVWAKIRILRDPLPLDFSVGALLKLPTGDDDDGLGTGNADLELFAAVRKALGPIEVSANAGVRFNGDLELPGPDLDGETSVLLGLGAAIWVNDQWALAAEMTLESERFDGAEEDVRITPQTEFRLTDFARIRLGVGFGLDDASPDIEGIASLAVVF